MPTPPPIVLSAEDRSKLERVTRSHSAERRQVQRAQTILDWTEGLPATRTSSKVGLSVTAIYKWRRRFRTNGMDGLQDEPRPGRPPVITPETRVQIVHKACTRPEDGRTRRSTRQVAGETGVSQWTVCRVLAEADLKPHRTEHWCGKSPDPEFDAKAAAVLGLYLNPPANALVLCVDEKTQIQALGRTQPDRPCAPGRPRRQTATYLRNGTACLHAALSVHDGQVTARPTERADAATFLDFLKELKAKYSGKRLLVIADNLSAHKHKDIKAWLAENPDVEMFHTPTYSSWLNQVEMWFSILTRDVLEGGRWDSKDELVEQLTAYIKTYNEQKAKPFKWTYTGKPLAA